jgi:hypothetical protein
VRGGCAAHAAALARCDAGRLRAPSQLQLPAPIRQLVPGIRCFYRTAVYYSQALYSYVLYDELTYEYCAQCTPSTQDCTQQLSYRIPYKNETLGHENHLLNHSPLCGLRHRMCSGRGFLPDLFRPQVPYRTSSLLPSVLAPLQIKNTSCKVVNYMRNYGKL